MVVGSNPAIPRFTKFIEDYLIENLTPKGGMAEWLKALVC
jgi:hypothetical protein